MHIYVYERESFNVPSCVCAIIARAKKKKTTKNYNNNERTNTKIVSNNCLMDEYKTERRKVAQINAHRTLWDTTKL